MIQFASDEMPSRPNNLLMALVLLTMDARFLNVNAESHGKRLLITTCGLERGRRKHDKSVHGSTDAKSVAKGYYPRE